MIWPVVAEPEPLPPMPEPDADSSRGTELHAASAAARAVMVMLFAMRELMCLFPLRKSHTWLLIGEGAPYGFPDLSVQGRQGLAYTSIDGGDCQYAASALHGTVQDLHTVWRETWRLVVGARCQQLLGASGHVLHGNPVCAI